MSDVITVPRTRGSFILVLVNAKVALRLVYV